MVRSIRFAETAEDLLKEMDFFGIDEALIFHSRQIEDSREVKISIKPVLKPLGKEAPTS